MERLTHKVDGEYYPIQNILGSVRPRIHAKLGKLEDIEEELGIPLEVLFKALKDGIWVKGNKWIDNHKVLNFGVSINEWSIYNDDFFRGTKDYGKTWALTRKELE